MAKDIRCEWTTPKGRRCTSKKDGAGTLYCEQHHRMHFGEPQCRDACGNIAGRPGYLGHHGHLNR